MEAACALKFLAEGMRSERLTEMSGGRYKKREGQETKRGSRRIPPLEPNRESGSHLNF